VSARQTPWAGPATSCCYVRVYADVIISGGLGGGALVRICVRVCVCVCVCVLVPLSVRVRMRVCVCVRGGHPAMPLEDRLAIFLKAADLAATKYRADLCAAVMLGALTTPPIHTVSERETHAHTHAHTCTCAKQVTWSHRPVCASMYVWGCVRLCSFGGVCVGRCVGWITGTGKTTWQAEIDAGAELVDFWRFNALYGTRLSS
jgi:hypothetical protein